MRTLEMKHLAEQKVLSPHPSPFRQASTCGAPPSGPITSTIYPGCLLREAWVSHISARERAVAALREQHVCPAPFVGFVLSKLCPYCSLTCSYTQILAELKKRGDDVIHEDSYNRHPETEPPPIPASDACASWARDEILACQRHWMPLHAVLDPMCAEKEPDCVVVFDEVSPYAPPPLDDIVRVRRT